MITSPQIHNWLNGWIKPRSSKLSLWTQIFLATWGRGMAVVGKEDKYKVWLKKWREVLAIALPCAAASARSLHLPPLYNQIASECCLQSPSLLSQIPLSSHVTSPRLSNPNFPNCLNSSHLLAHSISFYLPPFLWIPFYMVPMSRCADAFKGTHQVRLVYFY